MSTGVDIERLSSEFGPFDGRVWLNCAHQGPLPHVAELAVLEAIALKRTPARLRDALFSEVPDRLREALAKLITTVPDQIALTNSTSYGFNLLAQGLPWRNGDEILCIKGDFPATVVPWLPLGRHGVRVRLLDVAGARLTPEQLDSAITNRTRAVCISWVFSYFGHAVDLEAFGSVCRQHEVFLFVNGSQAVGARQVNVSALPVDALSCCGFKWLCGPYATGFVWLSPEVLESLDYANPHWLRLQLQAAKNAGTSLDRSLDYTLVDEQTASAYDVFCAANFLNFMGWTASVDHLLDIGPERIEEHDQALVTHLLHSVPARFGVRSPREPHQRSTLVIISHSKVERNVEVAKLLREQGIDVALRGGMLRISPHLYNSSADIDRVLDVLELGT